MDLNIIESINNTASTLLYALTTPVVAIIIVYSVINLILLLLGSVHIIDKRFQINFFTPLVKILKILVSPVVGLVVAALAMLNLSIDYNDSIKQLVGENNSQTRQIIRENNSQIRQIITENNSQLRNILKDIKNQKTNDIDYDKIINEMMKLLAKEQQKTNKNSE